MSRNIPLLLRLAWRLNRLGHLFGLTGTCIDNDMPRERKQGLGPEEALEAGEEAPLCGHLGLVAVGGLHTSRRMKHEE